MESERAKFQKSANATRKCRYQQQKVAQCKRNLKRCKKSKEKNAKHPKRLWANLKRVVGNGSFTFLYW